ncbi:hypothetical protein PS1_0178 [Aeromonas phage PS1]|uniref:Uncharacterized protein n=1 Tax=Aeromonas phage PS1 TaxID=2591406 RepID=A0A514TUJ1_9CAUD|nr:hypothetical protein PQC64_gp085 [Aeromonas phage PS1]QDJ96689.1 hypothetical protein PS1_0178 [Aeromonas phage PS1]
MLQQVCVHQGKRHRFFIMEEQNVSTFVNAVNDCKRDDIYVTGAIEDADLDKRFYSSHYKLCFSVELGFGILAYGLKEADGIGIPGFINKHTDCRESVNKLGIVEFIRQGEMKFLQGKEDQATFDFSEISDEKFLDKTIIDKIDETLRKEGLQLTPSQILVLNKYIKE